jgi:hypothetical protein
VQNTNPGNGNNGTYKDLGHWDQQFPACIDPTKRISGGTYGKDPSQSCITTDVLKFNNGTSGTTPTVYSAVFNGLNYVPVLVNAVFKAGNACCSGQVYGVGCCAPGSLIGTNVSGTMSIPGYTGINFFNSSNGYVPAGCNNSGLGSTTVAVSNPNNEFCFKDGANADNADFTANTLTLTDVSIAGSVALSYSFQLPPGLVTSVTETSDNFQNGGMNFSLVGNVLTLNQPQFNSGGTFTAVYTFTTACLPVGARIIWAGTPDAPVSTGSGGIKSKSPSMGLPGEIRVYPNPNNGAFSLQLPYFENQAKVTVANVQGQVVLTKLVSEKDGSKVNLDLGKVAGGVYFVEVTYGGQRTMTKMTVQ